jgi:predicted enzyme related to lactoylglutathione lyase
VRLGYVNLFVRDLDRAVAFYRDRLGLPVTELAPEAGFAAFDAGTVRLAVAVVGDAQAELAGRHTGVGLVVDDLETAHARLAAEGVAFPMAPSRQPWGGFMALMADPDGNVLYLDERPAP